MERYDIVVIGAGVIGCSVAFHLARLGAKRVLLLDRGTVASGTSAQSSGILRTHYSVRHNVELARDAWGAFADFAAYVGDAEASCGLVRCGYLVWAADGDKVEPLALALEQQRQLGIEVNRLTSREAQALLPIARLDDAALIGYEPAAGYADAYLTATSFARAARRAGVTVREGVAVSGLRMQGARVVGLQTTQGDIACGMVVAAQNIWTGELASWLAQALPGAANPVLPVAAERHAVLALACAEAPYTAQMPVFKDLSSPGMLYGRSYGGGQMLVSEGLPGELLPPPHPPEIAQGDVDLDQVAAIGEQVAQRFPAYAGAGLHSRWTGVYDVTPDWNPVLGALPGVDGLIVGFGFSGHGFKLSPTVGRLLAQAALQQPTDRPLAPYSIQRFERGHWLRGGYGRGAVS